MYVRANNDSLWFWEFQYQRYVPSLSSSLSLSLLVLWIGTANDTDNAMPFDDFTILADCFD
jgi:hypothetical protein